MPLSRRGLLAAVAVLLLAAGCGAPARMYVNPQADLTLYHKIAVLPFTNLSQVPFAGERITRGFVTELIMTDQFQVVEGGEFADALDKIGGSPDASGKYDPAKLKEAANAIQATGLLRGAVTEYSTQHSGQSEYPVLAFDAELVDVATGNVVWRISLAKKGKSPLSPLGLSGSNTFGKLTQEACADAVASLKGKAF
jgi:TolB-like protein